MQTIFYGCKMIPIMKYSCSLGTNQNDDALNSKANPKNGSAKDEKSSTGDNSTDDIFEKENGISNEKAESNPLVSTMKIALF